MARLAAKTDPLSETILVNPNPNWHQHNNPYFTEYTDTHVITYILPNTLHYHESLTPIYDENSYIKIQAIQILYIHHRTTTIGDISSLQ
jgi:hypothetical protein